MKEETLCRAARLQFISVTRFSLLVSGFHWAWPHVREMWAGASSVQCLQLLEQWKSLHIAERQIRWKMRSRKYLLSWPAIWTSLYSYIHTHANTSKCKWRSPPYLHIGTFLSHNLAIYFFFLTGQRFSLLHPQVLLILNFTNSKSLQKLFPKPAAVKQIHVFWESLST